jgi:hypothetical protein
VFLVYNLDVLRGISREECSHFRDVSVPLLALTLFSCSNVDANKFPCFIFPLHKLIFHVHDLNTSISTYTLELQLL